MPINAKQRGLIADRYLKLKMHNYMYLLGIL